MRTASGIPTGFGHQRQPRALPSGILQHDRLPSRQLCRECFAAYLLSAPVFARLTPAGRRPSAAPSESPGGQPVPHHPSGDPPCGCPAPPLPRWAWCPVDQHLHLLSPAKAAGIGGHGRAGCGRWVPRSGLNDRGPCGAVLSGLRSGGDRVVSPQRAGRYDRWRDVDGTHVAVGARVEQAQVDARMGAPRSRLHAQGLVTGQGATRLRVRFDGEDQPVSIRPHLIRVIPR